MLYVCYLICSFYLLIITAKAISEYWWLFELAIDSLPGLAMDGIDVAIDSMFYLAIDVSWLAIDLHFTWIDYITSNIYN